jgi:hypothetical protein
VGDIAKSILSGGWSLVAGWILPAGLSVGLFGLFVLPSLHGIALLAELMSLSAGQRSIVGLAAAVVIGVTLSVLRTPLYRILEGNLFWPQWLAKEGRDRQARAKQAVADRMFLIRLRQPDRRLPAWPADFERQARILAGRRMRWLAWRDAARTTVQVAVLRERLRRYPVSDKQLVPTRLGNAIRRYEEYGFDRYLLDSQAVWYELTAVAPRELARQVETARVGVDFFVCLLSGNLLVALAALFASCADPARYPVSLVTAAVLAVLSRRWYMLAVATTDDLALAVRALVDVGRKPLAAALNLSLPRELEKEREMWDRYCRSVRSPYNALQPPHLDDFRHAGS